MNDIQKIYQLYDECYELINTHLVMATKLQLYDSVCLVDDGSDRCRIIAGYLRRLGGEKKLFRLSSQTSREDIENHVSTNYRELVVTGIVQKLDELPREMTCFTPEGDGQFYDEYRPLFFWNEEDLQKYKEIFMAETK